MEKYMVKFAWKCNHELYGEILSFAVTPKVQTSPFSYGYKMNKDLEEVFRFPSDHPKALSIVRRLSKVNSTQWTHPSFGDIVEEEFDPECFIDEDFYQNNYGRDVTFHTHINCY